MNSDPELIRAFKHQCLIAERGGMTAYEVWLMWRGQPDIDEDELLDIAKKLTIFKETRNE